MPTFKPPVYSKQTNSKGQVESSYLFPIEYAANEESISTVVDSITDLSIADLVKEHNIWYDEFLQRFLSQSAKFFSKQYTVSDISKIIQHTLMSNSDAESAGVCTVLLRPKQIQIISGKCIVYWSYTCEPVRIDISGLSDSLPDLNQLPVNEVAEVNMDELPEGDPTESMELLDPAKLYERQKVKEAILRAKVAYYQAQHKIRTFSDKYGDEYSDSEFELDDTENESEEEDEEDQ
jgi:hypothetical protein